MLNAVGAAAEEPQAYPRRSDGAAASPAAMRCRAGGRGRPIRVWPGIHLVGCINSPLGLRLGLPCWRLPCWRLPWKRHGLPC